MMSADYAAKVAADVAARYGIARGVDPVVVKQVPCGASGQPLPVWNGTQLVYPEDAKLAWRAAQASQFRRKIEPLSVVELRRARVRALHAQGFTDVEMADALGVRRAVVYIDRTALELPCNRAPIIRSAAVARQERIRALAEQGASLQDICADVGLSPLRVREIARLKLGVTIRRANSVDDRRASVAALFAEGLDQAAIVARLKVKAQLVHRDLLALGLVLRKDAVPVVPKPGSRRAINAEAQARRVQIKAALDAGLTLVEARDKLAVARYAFRRDLSALGISWRSYESAKPVPTLAVPQEERLPQLPGLIAAGMRHDALCQMFRINRRTLSRDLREAGLKIPALKKADCAPAGSGPKRRHRAKQSVEVIAAQRAAIAARRAALTELAAAGHTRDQIALALGVSLKMVREDIFIMKLPVPKLSTAPKTRPGRKPKAQAVVADIADHRARVVDAQACAVAAPLLQEVA